MQQIDHTSTAPLTTTYTNDIIGLSQVLVSSNGTTTTYNLFGLDLIHQDDGTEARFMLADGLGSVRTEMVGNGVETITTYEPYGKLLAQTGSSGTVYGFTGEQYDALTSLVYLRARYYNPSLKLFMSRDPFPGWIGLPASQHGYSYAHNNPVNVIDPTGEFGVPGAIIGGVVGGVIGAAGYSFVVYRSGGEFNSRDFAIVAGVGFLAGAYVGSGVGLLVPIGAGIGFGSLGQLAGSALTQSDFCLPAFLIAAGVGGLTGAVGGVTASMPVAQTTEFAIGLGATANTLQYGLTEKIAYGRNPSAVGLGFSFLTGGMAGGLSGPFPSFKTGTNVSSAYHGGVMSYGTKELLRQNTHAVASQFIRSIVASFTSNLPADNEGGLTLIRNIAELIRALSYKISGNQE